MCKIITEVLKINERPTRYLKKNLTSQMNLPKYQTASLVSMNLLLNKSITKLKRV